MFLVNVLHLICLWVNYQVKLTVQIENFGDLFFLFYIREPETSTEKYFSVLHRN